MSKSKRFWTIEVIGRGGDLVGRYDVPLHRLEKSDVTELLKALVAKYENLEFEAVVNSFLNNRKGGPLKYVIGEPQCFMNLEKAHVGYYLFGRTVYAWARHSISAEAVEFVRKIRNPVAA